MALRNPACTAGLTWHKSSYSYENGSCVEVAAVPVGWHKSSYSVENGSCVEVAAVAARRAVRDSKHPVDGAYLILDRSAMTSLVSFVRATS